MGRYCHRTDHNPHCMPKTHTQSPQKLNVWAGIIGDRILEPVFLDGNLDGATHVTLLQEDLMAPLATLFPNRLDPDLPDERIWYQQDGAPPHYAVFGRKYLVFPNR
jgi:hypothetical protein